MPTAGDTPEIAEYERAGACRRPELSACRSAGYERPGVGVAVRVGGRITSRCGRCAEAPRCTKPSSYSGRAVSVRVPPWDAGLQPSRAEVAAYHRLRFAEKAAVAVGFVAEREADQVVSDPHRDEAPGGEPVRGQAIPGGEHVVEQVREIVVALPLLPFELAAARRGVEDLAEPRYAAENLRVRVDRCCAQKPMRRIPR